MDKSLIKVGDRIRYKMVFDEWVYGVVTAVTDNAWREVCMKLEGFSATHSVSLQDPKLEVIN